MADECESHTVESAGSGEFDSFELIRNYLSGYNNLDATPCKHAYDVHRQEYDAGPNPKYYKLEWRLPWAVQGFNQGGHDCVAICLDCAVDARAALTSSTAHTENKNG